MDFLLSLGATGRMISILSFLLGKGLRRIARANGRRRSNRSFGSARRLALEALEPRLAPAVLMPGFTEAVAASGLSEATAMALSPGGKLFVAEQGGTMEVWQHGRRLQANFFARTPLHTQAVSERGLLGVALDPNFPRNHFVYVYYTTTAADNHNRVSRFRANASGNLALPGSERVLLNLDPHTAGNHNGGAIHFGPDGKLYIGVGDDANQDNPTGTPNAQRLTTLHGKLLRINPNGTIPRDNPFFNQTKGKYRAIWALGLRNPFTFAFQPGTGRMFIDDVGQNTWEEIDVGKAGANYGWPATEGSFDQSAFPGFTEPLFAYNHSASVTTPSGIAITGGAFYNPRINQFGAGYQGDYFFADLGGDWIYRIDPATKIVTQFATNVPTPVDLNVDAAGNLYYLARGSGKVFVVSRPAAKVGPNAQAFFVNPPVSGLANRNAQTAGVMHTHATARGSNIAAMQSGLDSRFINTFAIGEIGHPRMGDAGVHSLYAGAVAVDARQHDDRLKSASLAIKMGFDTPSILSPWTVEGPG